jgi:Tfp pilus assembly protein PilV
MKAKVVLFVSVCALVVILTVATSHENSTPQQQPQRQIATKAEEARQKASSQKAHDNFNGIAHDPFICSLLYQAPTDPVVSFDNGETWWNDDGRCAPRLATQIEEARKKQSAEAQKRRSEEKKLLCKLSSKRKKQKRHSDGEMTTQRFPAIGLPRFAWTPI